MKRFSGREQRMWSWVTHLKVCGDVNGSIIQALQLFGHQRHPEGSVISGGQDHLGKTEIQQYEFRFHTYTATHWHSQEEVVEKHLCSWFSDFCNLSGSNLFSLLSLSDDAMITLKETVLHSTTKSNVLCLGTCCACFVYVWVLFVLPESGFPTTDVNLRQVSGRNCLCACACSVRAWR